MTKDIIEADYKRLLPKFRKTVNRISVLKKRRNVMKHRMDLLVMMFRSAQANEKAKT